MKITVRTEPYIITDGNGGTKQAKIKKMTQKPPRVHYVTRKGGIGRFTVHPVECTIPAFRKLLIEQA